MKTKSQTACRGPGQDLIKHCGHSSLTQENDSPFQSPVVLFWT